MNEPQCGVEWMKEQMKNDLMKERQENMRTLIPEYRIKLEKIRDIDTDAPIISGSQHAYNILRAYMEDLAREHYVVMLLDFNRKLQGIITIAQGRANSTHFELRDVFAPALKHNCDYVILAHNHPAGSAKPSKDDFKSTNAIIRCGQMLGINVVDHIVVGAGEGWSFVEGRLLKPPCASNI